MPLKKRDIMRHMTRVYDDTWARVQREMKVQAMENVVRGSYRGFSALFDQLANEALDARDRKRERSGKNVA